MTFVLVYTHTHTCVSLSCFLKVLNLKNPSLSEKDDLFLAEPRALAGEGMRFRGEVDGNLWRKRGHPSCLDTIYVIVQGPALKQAPPTHSPKPVKCIVVLQILAAPAPLHVFNHMVLQKLFEELHSLLPGHLRPKVAVAAEQLVEPVHSSRGSEAGGIVTKVLPVFPEGHTRPEQTRHLVPLKNSKTI